MDYDLRRALDVLAEEGQRYSDSVHIELVLDYLRARIPVHTAARALLLVVADSLASYRQGQFAFATGLTEFEPVAEAITALRAALEQAELPELRRPRSPEELSEVAAMIGVRGDWHEPDEQEVDAVVAAGSFDNAGHAVLEKMVVVYQEGVPVAEVALATVMAWACQAARPVKTALPAAGTGAVVPAA